MQEPHHDWESEIETTARGCWINVKGQEDRENHIYRPKRHQVSLRAPPLFRSIGQTEISPGLPPHRRLRSIFRQSRAVLPADPCVESLALGPPPPATHTGILSRTDAQWTARDLAISPPRLTTPPRTRSEAKSRWSGAVSPLKQEGHPGTGSSEAGLRGGTKRAMEGKMKRPDREWPGTLTPESAEEEGLSRWLKSLDIADRVKEIPPSNIRHHGCRTLFEAGVGKRVTKQVEGGFNVMGHRRDRRPHFLPPIVQSGSLLSVPLLLPENSPPPSPCSSLNTPFVPLPVPQLHPSSQTRKLREHTRETREMV